jgi:hypothetical protein
MYWPTLAYYRPPARFATPPMRQGRAAITWKQYVTLENARGWSTVHCIVSFEKKLFLYGKYRYKSFTKRYLSWFVAKQHMPENG